MNEHNRLVHWAAARGLWPLFLLMPAYKVGAVLFVSFAPKRLALAGLFAFILCDYHGAASWTERHRGFGNTGFIIYGILLAAVIVLMGFRQEKELTSKDPQAASIPVSASRSSAPPR